MNRVIFGVIACIVLSSSAVASDRFDCVSGPIYIESDLPGQLNGLDRRIAACFNYSQEIEIENHNRLVDKINDLEGRLSDLEFKLSTLRNELDQRQ